MISSLELSLTARYEEGPVLRVHPALKPESDWNPGVAYKGDEIWNPSRSLQGVNAFCMQHTVKRDVRSSVLTHTADTNQHSNSSGIIRISVEEQGTPQQLLGFSCWLLPSEQAGSLLRTTGCTEGTALQQSPQEEFRLTHPEFLLGLWMGVYWCANPGTHGGLGHAQSSHRPACVSKGRVLALC